MESIPVRPKRAAGTLSRKKQSYGYNSAHVAMQDRLFCHEQAGGIMNHPPTQPRNGNGRKVSQRMDRSTHGLPTDPVWIVEYGG